MEMLIIYNTSKDGPIGFWSHREYLKCTSNWRRKTKTDKRTGAVIPNSSCSKANKEQKPACIDVQSAVLAVEHELTWGDSVLTSLPS